MSDYRERYNDFMLTVTFGWNFQPWSFLIQQIAGIPYLNALQWAETDQTFPKWIRGERRPLQQHSSSSIHSLYYKRVLIFWPLRCRSLFAGLKCVFGLCWCSFLPCDVISRWKKARFCTLLALFLTGRFAAKKSFFWTLLALFLPGRFVMVKTVFRLCWHFRWHVVV